MRPHLVPRQLAAPLRRFQRSLWTGAAGVLVTLVLFQPAIVAGASPPAPSSPATHGDAQSGAPPASAAPSTSVLATPGGAVTGSLANDQTQLVVLEQELSVEQAQAASLAQRYDAATTRLAKLEAAAVTDTHDVAVTAAHLRLEHNRMAMLAVRSLVEGAVPATPLFSSPEAAQARGVYEENALGNLRRTARTYAMTRHRLDLELATAEAARSGAQATQAQVLALERQNRAATAQIEASLASVQANLAQAAMAALTLNDSVTPAGISRTGTAAALPPAPPTPTPRASAAVAAAISQIGDPYVWGGETPRGPGNPGAFDCSGLTQWAWAQAGVHIPRTSQQQWASLPHVQLEKVQPGDLLFYYNLDGTHTVDHVVMYVGAGPYGRRTIVAAPYTGAFVGFEPFFGTGFVGAARP